MTSRRTKVKKKPVSVGAGLNFFFFLGSESRAEHWIQLHNIVHSAPLFIICSPTHTASPAPTHRRVQKQLRDDDTKLKSIEIVVKQQERATQNCERRWGEQPPADSCKIFYVPWFLLWLFHFNIGVKFAIFFHSATFLLRRSVVLDDWTTHNHPRGTFQFNPNFVAKSVLHHTQIFSLSLNWLLSSSFFLSIFLFIALLIFSFFFHWFSPRKTFRSLFFAFFSLKLIFFFRKWVHTKDNGLGIFD